MQGEQIALIAVPGALPEAGRVIDATGKIVVPGGVEPHTHLAHFVAMHPDENLFTLGPEEDSRGMAFGGTTTHVDFCFVRPGGDVATAIEQRAARWKGNSYVDYTFHVALQGALPLKVFDQLPEAIQAGIPLVQGLHHRGPAPASQAPSVSAGLRAHPAGHGEGRAARRDHGRARRGPRHRPVHVREAARGRADGGRQPRLVHNKLSEALSFRRTIHLAEATGAAIYFVHTSAREGVDAVREARSPGQPVYAETLHHYACFTAEDYKRRGGSATTPIRR